MAKPLAPTVGERLARCGTHVEVWGTVPGADVTLQVDTAMHTVVATSTATTFTVPPLPPLVKVHARQQDAGGDSGWGNVVTIDDVLFPPAPPVTEATIPGCAKCIAAWGAPPGSRVEITAAGSLVADGEVNRQGWTCMNLKLPGSSTMQSTTIACGLPSEKKGSIGVYPTPAVLPPPVIVEPVFECQTNVLLENLVPGASVEIFVTDAGGATVSLGSFCACGSRVNANVGRQMQKGDRLKASQSMVDDQRECNSRSPESAEVAVVPPDARIMPKIVEPVYESAPLILVTNQVLGGMITWLSRPTAGAPEDNLGSRPSAEFPEVPVPDPPLHEGQVLRIRQDLCGVSEYSDPVTVQKLPATLDPPVVRKPLFACGEVVAVDEVMSGRLVHVYQSPPKTTGPMYHIGSQWSKGTSVVVNVAPVLLADAFVTAVQEVGGVSSPPAPLVHVLHKPEFPPPKVVPPVIVGQKTVWLEDVVPGAHIRIFDRGMQVGSGSLPDEAGLIELWWPIPLRAIITARQALCTFESAESAPRPAIPDAPCDGPPVYDPGKWNDGGMIQGCNNCYNYACDIRTDNFAQPGGGTTNDCTAAASHARSDGLQPCLAGHCHPCHHRVALVVAPGYDYHWYRQGPDGFWSHKRGCRAAKNVDESYNLITDPALADRGPYTDFCGYFCVYKPDVSIGGPGCKCWP